MKDFTGTIEQKNNNAGDSQRNYPDDVYEPLRAIIDLAGLQIEICGAWVWVDGDTYSNKDKLNDAGYRFAGKKKKWYFRPDDWKSSSRGTYDMEDIREKFGSERPARATRVAIE